MFHNAYRYLAPASNAEVSRELVRMFYDQATLLLVGHASVSWFCVWFLWEPFSHPLLIGWATAITAVSALRQIATLMYRRVARAEDTDRWAYYFLTASFLSGVAWGFGTYHFFDLAYPAEAMALTVIAAGATAASYFSLWSYVPASLSFSVMSMGPLSWHYFHAGERPYVFVAGLILVYIVTLLLFSRRTYRNTVDLVALRLEKEGLVRQLTGRQAGLERANEELQLQKEKAEAANIAKSKFLAAASHDLRQPLHALRLFVSALDARVDSPKERRLMNNIVSSIEALEQLLNSLLDLSRIDAGVLEPERTDFALQPLFDRIGTEFCRQAEDKEITLRIIPTSVVVYSDPGMLERILRNLVSNAVRYTERGGVLLGCRRQGKNIAIQVLDTGIGIPSDQINAVFKEFYQLGNPERDRTKGLGLGLAIVQGLAKLLRHELRVQSRPGRGSCFQIRVPGGRPATPRPSMRYHPSADGIMERALVLFIDDDAAVRAGMAEILLDWGCEMLITESAEEAIEKLVRAPDVIIADYRLREGRTGYDAIQKVRAHFRQRIPGIVITGDTAPERLREARSSGCPLLHKPVNPDKMRAMVEQLLVDKIESVGSAC